jgi:hypothetical protein
MNQHMELCVYLETSPYDVEIEGSALALGHFAELLKAATDSTTSIEVSSKGPELVHSIAVRECGGALQIRYSSGILYIEGAKDKLEILVQNVKFLAFSNPESTHIHVEYYNGNPYIDAESIPLVVTGTTKVLGSHCRQ